MIEDDRKNRLFIALDMICHGCFIGREKDIRRHAAECLKSAGYDNHNIRSALQSAQISETQSPPVPVIEGLEEATSYIIGLVHTAQRNIKLCNLTQADLEYKKADMLLTCVKACEEYSKLQKGE